MVCFKRRGFDYIFFRLQVEQLVHIICYPGGLMPLPEEDEDEDEETEGTANVDRIMQVSLQLIGLTLITMKHLCINQKCFF